MKLRDKRFWKFELLMVLCGFLCFCMAMVALIVCRVEIDSMAGIVLILLIPLFTFHYVICGMPTWLLLKEDYSWAKLFVYLYSISATIALVVLLIFFFDWNSTVSDMRPVEIPAEEGKFFAGNEIVLFICVGWLLLTLLPTIAISFICRKWILKPKTIFIE